MLCLLRSYAPLLTDVAGALHTHLVYACVYVCMFGACRVVQQQRAVVVLLVDLLDVSGSLLGKVRELVGKWCVGLVFHHGSCVMSFFVLLCMLFCS